MASNEAKIKVEVEIGKCVLAGCEIPRRHELKHMDLGVRFWVCGEHRKPLAELLNRCVRDVTEARTGAVQKVIDGVDSMGDHSMEKNLALAV